MIGHSFGVTLTRRALKGGLVFGDFEPYYIGEPLNKRVNTYIGISGRNWGSNSCLDPDFFSQMKVCSKLNGMYPGERDAEPYPDNLSLALRELNMDPIKEADHTYAIYSVLDSDNVYSRATQQFPTMDDFIKFDGPQYDHCGCRDYSGETQYNLVTYHSFVPPTENEY